MIRLYRIEPQSYPSLAITIYCFCQNRLDHYVWLEVRTHQVGEWKYSMTSNGALFVMIPGTTKMPVWFANSLVLAIKVSYLLEVYGAYW